MTPFNRAFAVAGIMALTSGITITLPAIEPECPKERKVAPIVPKSKPKSTQQHSHSREIARRLRQEANKAAKNGTA